MKNSHLALASIRGLVAGGRQRGWDKEKVPVGLPQLPPACFGSFVQRLNRGLVRLRAPWLMGLALLLAGCRTTEPAVNYNPTLARFFLESAGGAGAEFVLPRSGVRLVVNAKPVFTEGDVVGVELAQVELGRCLMFTLTPAAARDFYRLSGSNQGRRLLLLLNGAPAGARRLDGPIADGVVFVFVEMPDEALPGLVSDLKQSTAAIQRTLARKKS